MKDITIEEAQKQLQEVFGGKDTIRVDTYSYLFSVNPEKWITFYKCYSLGMNYLTGEHKTLKEAVEDIIYKRIEEDFKEMDNALEEDNGKRIADDVFNIAASSLKEEI